MDQRHAARTLKRMKLDDTFSLHPEARCKPLAAQILRLRMKGKHEEADQHLTLEAVLDDEETSVDEPRHEKVRSSIRSYFIISGHCVILPLQHESATGAIDSSVWEEIRNFKKCLLKMFALRGKDMIFFETVVSLANQQRHCMIECIPVSHEVSDKAPMYLKKAIDEAKEEWSQHEMKKLTPTSGNLRQVIPENFAYFHVEFVLDREFVHVIDYEIKFSAGFGLNVIREDAPLARRGYAPLLSKGCISG